MGWILIVVVLSIVLAAICILTDWFDPWLAPDNYIRVDVTQEDINLSSLSATNYPVARALQRVFPNHDGIGVTPRWMTIYLKGHNPKITIPTPKKAAAFIKRYDRGKLVSPFSFKLKKQ